MKNTILILFVLSSNIVAYCQVEDAIFKKVIDDYVLKLQQPNIDYTLKTTLTVLEKSYSMDTLSMDDYTRFKGKYKKLEKQTFLNFITKAEENVQFGKITIPQIEFVIINRDSIPKRNELLSKYPHWIFSILEFSNIGFNEAKNQAIVYYGFDSGPGVGGGIYIIYEKKRKKWKQKGFIPAWAA